MKGALPKWKLLEIAAQRTHAYNLIGLNWWLEEAEMTVCALFEGFCEKVLKGFADGDTSVDNMDRLERMLVDYPAGAPYQNMVFFAQMSTNDNFYQFNYGPIENRRKYG